MGRMSELGLAIQGVQRAADDLIATCKELMALCGGKEAADVTEAPAPKPKPITLEQVRAVLAEKSRAGHTAEVRALLEKHGAAKLSEIDPTKYSALLKDAEVLGNGSLSTKIVCGECGHTFKRKTCGGITYWVCYSHNLKKENCSVKQIPEAEIHTAFIRLWGKLKQNHRRCRRRTRGSPAVSQRPGIPVYRRRFPPKAADSRYETEYVPRGALH